MEKKESIEQILSKSDIINIIKNLESGQDVYLIEIENNQIIDRLLVKKVKKDSDYEVDLESLNLNPGNITTFAFIENGWKMLFKCPMTKKRCYNKTGSVYKIVKVDYWVSPL
jgi:hypothetical protein